MNSSTNADRGGAVGCRNRNRSRSRVMLTLTTALALTATAVIASAPVRVAGGWFSDASCGGTCAWSNPATWGSGCCYPHSPADTAEFVSSRTVVLDESMVPLVVSLEHARIHPNSAVSIVGGTKLQIPSVDGIGSSGGSYALFTLNTNAAGAGAFSPPLLFPPGTWAYLHLVVRNDAGLSASTPCEVDASAYGASKYRFYKTDAVGTTHLRIRQPPAGPVSSGFTLGDLTISGSLNLSAALSGTGYVFPVSANLLTADLNAPTPSLTVDAASLALETAVIWLLVADSGNTVVPGGVRIAGYVRVTCSVQCWFRAPARHTGTSGSPILGLAAAPTILFGEPAPNTIRSVFAARTLALSGGRATLSATDMTSAAIIAASGTAVVQLDSASTVAGTITLADSALLTVAGPTAVVSGSVTATGITAAVNITGPNTVVSGSVSSSGDNARVQISGCTVTTTSALTASGTGGVLQLMGTDFSGAATLSGTDAAAHFAASTFRGAATASGDSAGVWFDAVTVVGTAAAVRLTGVNASFAPTPGSQPTVIVDGAQLTVSRAVSGPAPTPHALTGRFDGQSPANRANAGTVVCDGGLTLNPATVSFGVASGTGGPARPKLAVTATAGTGGLPTRLSGGALKVGVRVRVGPSGQLRIADGSRLHVSAAP